MTIRKSIQNILGIKSDLVAADADTLRRSIATPEQRERAAAIIAEFREARAKDEAYEFPSERASVVLWDFGVAALADLTGNDRLHAERASLGGNSPEVLQQSERLHTRRRTAGRKAAALIVEIRGAYLPALDAEIARYRSGLVELFAAFEVESEVEQARPLQRLRLEREQHGQLDPARIGFGAELCDALPEVVGLYLPVA